MAISVDTVYQRVLALANKEQRGYITPQEFNLLANQAQMSIFESYFYAKNQRDRAEPSRTNEVDESDIGELIDRKLGPFQSFETITSGHTFPTTTSVGSHSVFQTGLVLLGDEPCQKVSMFDAQRLRKSQRHMATATNQSPIYTDNRVTGRDIVIYAEEVAFNDSTCDYNNDPTITHVANSSIKVGLNVSGSGIPAGASVVSITSATEFELSASTTGGSLTNQTLTFSPDMTVECFRVPVAANWTYVVVNSKALYNSSIAVNFELHRSEEDTLVYNILALAGIVMNKVGLAQTASQMSGTEQQNQNT